MRRTVLFTLPRRAPPRRLRSRRRRCPIAVRTLRRGRGCRLSRCVVGRFDHAEAAFAADRFACCELRALLLKLRRLFVPPGLLAPLPLSLLGSGVLLDRGRRDTLG